MVNSLATTFKQCRVVTIMLAVCSLIWIALCVIPFFGPLRASHPFLESSENPVAANLLTAEEFAAKTEFASKARRIFLI